MVFGVTWTYITWVLSFFTFVGQKIYGALIVWWHITVNVWDQTYLFCLWHIVVGNNSYGDIYRFIPCIDSLTCNVIPTCKRQQFSARRGRFLCTTPENRIFAFLISAARDMGTEESFKSNGALVFLPKHSYWFDFWLFVIFDIAFFFFMYLVVP